MVSTGLLKLYSSMAVTILVVTLISSLVLYFVLSLFMETAFIYLLFIILVFYFVQWLLSPYIIDMFYHTRPLPSSYSYIQDIVNDISRRSGIKTPKVLIADIPIPNAFAYGSPLTGYRVAVTRGLLEALPRDEIAAVLAHEIGHIKHRDITVMMLVGLIPAIVLWLGEYLVRWGWLFGFYERRREESLTPLALIALGIVLIIIGFILNLGVLYLSRLREYYADSHAALTIPNGARLLQRALARIMIASGWLKKHRVNLGKYSQLKMLFISPPEHAIAGGAYDVDSIVEEIKRMKPSILQEIFSTHPHPAKRFRFLDELTGRQYYA
ncbi:zinc metalloprotease HtpX [Desulfurococcaceae archaeon MEX13E-LK6-19]|nr:zinc metalloprotease HtpX [Desulfurococcaceae archaeon MEX13E-LK6-19]